ncbi:hypothetical protein WJ25_16970 [Burkholderia thailandensis]|nr:hypothetical protein WJ25_16970 [Burkholderia thailandensis]
MSEFVPTLRVVPEPVAQFVAGRDVLEPGVEFHRFLLDASRPKAIDEKVNMSVITCVFIYALNLDCVFHDRDTPVWASPGGTRKSVPTQRCD